MTEPRPADNPAAPTEQPPVESAEIPPDSGVPETEAVAQPEESTQTPTQEPTQASTPQDTPPAEVAEIPTEAAPAEALPESAVASAPVPPETDAETTGEIPVQRGPRWGRRLAVLGALVVV